MARRYTQLTFTDAVKDVQEHYGSRRAGAMLESFDMDDAHLSLREAEFIQDRDSFYMASVGENEWPYVQFRGGPKGFLQVLDASTLAYLDYSGNRLRAKRRQAQFAGFAVQSQQERGLWQAKSNSAPGPNGVRPSLTGLPPHRR